MFMKKMGFQIHPKDKGIAKEWILKYG